MRSVSPWPCAAMAATCSLIWQQRLSLLGGLALIWRPAGSSGSSACWWTAAGACFGERGCVWYSSGLRQFLCGANAPTGISVWRAGIYLSDLSSACHGGRQVLAACGSHVWQRARAVLCLQGGLDSADMSGLG